MNVALKMFLNSATINVTRYESLQQLVVVHTGGHRKQNVLQSTTEIKSCASATFDKSPHDTKENLLMPQLLVVGGLIEINKIPSVCDIQAQRLLFIPHLN